MTSAPTFPRRSMLIGLGLAGGGLLTSCAQKVPARNQPTPSVTASGLIARTPFYVAHRGGGDDWPEMTSYAYAQAARLPRLQALEVSACLSADGVLVCSHDPNTERVTGQNRVIADTVWSELAELRVSSRSTRDPQQPSQPLARFEDVVRTYIDDFVLFVEPKVSAAAKPMMDVMVSLGQPDRVVWKQPVNSSIFTTARRQGFTTWGYVLDEPAHLGTHLDAFASSGDIDLLGVTNEQTDDFIRVVIGAADAHGKPTIAWPVHQPSDRDRALALGARGIMTSNPVGLLRTPS